MAVKAKKRKFENDYEPTPPFPQNMMNGYGRKIKQIKQDFQGQFDQFHSVIISDKEIKRKSLRKLLEFLQKNQDNQTFPDEVGPFCDLKFLASLLWRYNCTLSNEDLLLYDIIEHLEKHLCLDFRIASPLIFGQKSKTYYGEIIKYGRSLQKYLTPEQVIEYFDQKKMWTTLMKMTRFDRTANGRNIREFDPDCYDPRFILRTLVHLVKPGTKLNCKIMITSNALSFCFASTSFHDETLRALGYAFLGRFRRRLLELSEEHFPERVIYRLMLDVFQNSIVHHNQKINHHISQFMARVSKLALSAEDPLYSPLMSFLTQKPYLQLDSVPEFYKLFFSSSTEFCLKERQWVLRLLADSLVDSNDYGAACKIFALDFVESCMALFCTPLADYWSKLLLLKIFRACIELRSAARDMFLRLDFTTWLSNAISFPRTTVMEQFELASMFKSLAGQFQSLCSADGIDKAEKLANSERRQPFLRTKLQMNAQRIMRHLSTDPRIVIETDIEKRDQLVKWIKNEF